MSIKSIIAAGLVAAVLGGSAGAQTTASPRPQLRPLARPPIVSQRVTITPAVAAERAMAKLYPQGAGQRAVFVRPDSLGAGTQVRGWHPGDVLTMPRDAYFVFVDEQPGANWEHTARYVAVDKSSGEVLQSISARTAPREAQTLSAANPAAKAFVQAWALNRSTIRQVGRFGGVVQLLKVQRYAVLLSGGIDGNMNYPRYWNDLAFVYKALKQRYGYTDANIIVLYANGTHAPNEDLDGDGVADIDYAATRANLDAVMHQVANLISPTGKFFFFSTNHGGLIDAATKRARLYLWGDSIPDSDFAALAQSIHTGTAIYAMEQCFSGGMIDDLTGSAACSPLVCAMSAANAGEPSWGGADYDPWAEYWTAAVFGHMPGGAAVNADTNGDGKISMAEAFNYARTHEPSAVDGSEHPTLTQCNTAACQASLD